MQHLHARDPATWVETIWNALHGYRETCIPEHCQDYTDEWDDICTAMAWIAETLGLPDPVANDKQLDIFNHTAKMGDV